MSNATLYQVSATAQVDSLNVAEVAKPTGNWDQYASVITATAGGKVYLLGFKQGADELDVYEFLAAAPWVKATTTKLKLKVRASAKKSIVNTFTLGNRPHLAAYTAANGISEIYAMGDDLSLSAPLEHYRNHEPAISKNFTAVKFFTNFGQVVMLGYDIASGYVAAYNFGVIATSSGGVPPILVLPAWSHSWAPGWARFAFFQFGGSNFFLKTNIQKPNVNIDHLNDVLSVGTVEVGTHLERDFPDKGAEFLKLDFVEPFVLGAGDPYFVTYAKDTGKATFNRFHSDCRGWTAAATVTSQTAAGRLTPITMPDGKVFVLVC